MIHWTCHRCQVEWPCAGARVHLRTYFSGDVTALSKYLSDQLFVAAAELDLIQVPPELVNRFLSWVNANA